MGGYHQICSLDHDALRNDTTRAVVFAVFGGINMIILFVNLETLYRRHSELVYWLGIPLTIILIFEMVSIAILEVSNENSLTDLETIRVVLQSFIIPLFLLLMYEIAYIMHTARGVDFCCISLERQKRKRALFYLRMMRYMVWLSILCLTLFLLIVNILAIYASIDITFDLVERNQSSITPAEGQEVLNSTNRYSGQRFCSKSLVQSFRQTGTCSIGCLADVIPWILLLVLSLYFGLIIWRFGYRFSSSRSPHLIYQWILPLLASGLLAMSILLPRGTEYTVDLSFVLLNISLAIVTRKQQNEAKELQTVEDFISRFPHRNDLSGSQRTSARQPSMTSIDSSQLSLIDQAQTSSTSPLSFNQVTPLDGNIVATA